MLPNLRLRSLQRPNLLRRFVGRVRCSLPEPQPLIVWSTRRGLEALRDANEMGRWVRFAA